jgi:lipopolysaccharide heptosyltransferase II
LNKILVIQTAFIGDVILATAVLEKLHEKFPNARLDILVRNGNETLFVQHPYINNCLVWNKTHGKYKSLFSLIAKIRKEKYDIVINLHRFASSGFITICSNAKTKIGFDKNPFSFLFTKKVKHKIGNGLHEVERNQLLINEITDDNFAMPKLYPSQLNYERIKDLKTDSYVCMAPSSVWATKQLPLHKWVELCDKITDGKSIYLLGAKSDNELCEKIIASSKNKNIKNLCGKLNLLDSCSLMQNATMNYVNDSAPLHLSSAMNAPVTAFFCSTIPEFGFTPLSKNSTIVQVNKKLSCRPCGLHGFKKCPEGHFKCGNEIVI